MADITITDRVVGSHGMYRRETGSFTNDTSADYQIRTKLYTIISFRIMGTSTNSSDRDAVKYINYNDAGTTVAPGVVHIDASTLFGGNDVAGMYEAIGY